ncbi:MAG TPA: hypothetical protein VHE55_06300 [Fimbriimonadaceae bacterium]|nr:hypothetical protein [Fimbriimonadaceae bacterium]
MSFLALLALQTLALGPAQGKPSVLDHVKQDLVENGFSLSQRYSSESDVPFLYHADWANRKTGISVELNCAPCDSRAALDFQIKFLNRSGKWPEGTLFGLSLGQHCFAYSGLPSIENVKCDRYSVEVRVHAPAQVKPDDRGRIQLETMTLCEKLARRILGEAMAMDVNDDGTLRPTSHLTGMETDKRGLESLAKWASDHKVKVAYDNSREIASFTYHSRQVKLPLASDKAVVNGKEVDLGGKFVIARGSLWLVPSSELDDALR